MLIYIFMVKNVSWRSYCKEISANKVMGLNFYTVIAKSIYFIFMYVIFINLVAGLRNKSI